MCGICGVVEAQPDRQTVDRMNATLTHRGPDGEGAYWGEGVALAMRRLAIIDVGGSEQPLYNEDGRIVLVFNGEIYNYRQLRQALQARGHVFRTEGDGETIAHLYEEYGTSAPDHLRGQFAFALWDSTAKRLLLARDALGEKPLYYCHQPTDNRLTFGSEIKAILAHDGVPKASALPRMIAAFLSAGYWQANSTPFEGIQALPPAHTLVYEDGRVTLARYYAPPALAPADARADERDYLPELERLLAQAVERCMIADVPLGAFLSGGLDSSLIVALMRQYTQTRVRTFSIGFAGDDSFDETQHAQTVANALQTDHTPFIVTADALELLPKLVWHLDQPFADSSVLPTFLVSQLTRQHVTVALTGDGGDELFAGYERFVAGALVQSLRAVPAPLWRAVHALLARLPEGTGYYNLTKRARRFARGASLPLGTAYAEWVALFDARGISDLLGEAHATLVGRADGVNDLLAYNLAHYLPNDLLIKSDRMTMANSLEGRAPFLDRDLLDFAHRLPLNLKLKGRTTKYLLKKLAEAHLPPAIVHRPKHGFGAPVGAWLRKAEATLRDTLLSVNARQRGLLVPSAVEQLIREHVTGQRDHAQRLWALLTLEVWHTVFFEGTA
jgi:asparagine synthase (glutamine-hydrolysing)